MMRLTIGRSLETNRMFAVWRVDAPWQPVTKRGQGMRLGGGKGSIDHYVTPVKAGVKTRTVNVFLSLNYIFSVLGRVILEVGGKCEFQEVEALLTDVANKLPFKAMAVSQKMLTDMQMKEKWQEENNQNPYTMKYLIQNNMNGCHQWLSPFDFRNFCKYV